MSEQADEKVERLDSGGQTWSLRFAGRDGTQDWQWVHFDLVHSRARSTIEADAALPEFARHLLIGTDESSRVLTDGHAVAGVLPAYARTGDADEFEVTCWHFAMTPRYLVTGRRHATRTLVNLWEAVKGGLQPTSPTALVDLCIAEFAREVRDRLASLASELDPVEDVLIEHRDAGRLTNLGGRLGAARREATQLKRSLIPLARALLEDTEDELPDWARLSDQNASHRALHGALDDIAALQDRARSLQDELTTRLAEETNRRLYIVSVVTTLVMPATFVTGFFGMNTGGLLWAGDEVPHGTIYAALLCGAAVLSTLLLLRWKRLL
jgi:zinc transporter